MQVWKDNLYGTFMFYSKVNDTNWILTSSQSTVTSGSQVKFTATVTADAHNTTPPSGTVTFYDGCTVLDTVAVDGSSGIASTTKPINGAGTIHNVQAIYSGDANFYHNNANTVSVTVTQ